MMTATAAMAQDKIKIGVLATLEGALTTLGEDALRGMEVAMKQAGAKAGDNVFIALDVAASEFWAGNGRYEFKKSGEPARDSQGMVDLYVDWCRQYPIISIEDGCAEQDWHGWKLLTKALGDKVQLVGDDVFVTNPAILKKGIEEGIGNALLVKVNQIGTLTEALAAVETAHKAGYTAVMSHRSGETEGATIADLAVATNCGQIKTGAPARSLSIISSASAALARRFSVCHTRHRASTHARRDSARRPAPAASRATPFASGARIHRIACDLPRCSIATDIAALVADRAFDALKAPIRRVSAPHTPVPFTPSLEKLYIPSPDKIAAAVREVHGYGS